MKTKNKKILWVGLSLLLILGLIGSYFVFVVGTNDSFISIEKYYDSLGNEIKTGWRGLFQNSVVGGVEGVKYITMKIRIENKDTVPLTFTITQMNPTEINALRPLQNLSAGSGSSVEAVTGLIDIEPYENKNQTFSVFVKSYASTLRREASKNGSITIKVDPNPFGNFNIVVTSEINNNPAINPGCTENWTCSSWGSCISGTQSRTCTDASACGTTNNKPATTQNCSGPTWTVSKTIIAWADYYSAVIQTDADANGVLESYTCASSQTVIAVGAAIPGTSYLTNEGHGISVYKYSGSSGTSLNLIKPGTTNTYIKCQ